MTLTRKQQKAMFARINAPTHRVNRLPVQLSIIVPSTKNNRTLTRQQFLKRIDQEKTFMSNKFGGDTTVRAQGGFVEEKRGKRILIKENVAVVESSTTKSKFNKNLRSFQKRIEQKQKEWGQTSVGYHVEGQFFNYPKKKFIDSERKIKKIKVT